MCIFVSKCFQLYLYFVPFIINNSVRHNMIHDRILLLIMNIFVFIYGFQNFWQNRMTLWRQVLYTINAAYFADKLLFYIFFSDYFTSLQ